MHGDDDPMTTQLPWVKEVAKAQIRAFLSGDPIWEEAFHRDFLSPNMWTYYKYRHGYDPREHEYLPIPSKLSVKKVSSFLSFRRVSSTK